MSIEVFEICNATQDRSGIWHFSELATQNISDLYFVGTQDGSRNCQGHFHSKRTGRVTNPYIYTVDMGYLQPSNDPELLQRTY